MAVKKSNSSDLNPTTPRFVAVIFGVTGLVGKEIAKRLLSRYGWKVYGVARRSDFIPIQNHDYHFISCDLMSSSETMSKLSSLEDVTHVFWITWTAEFPLDTLECCEQNKSMMANALNAILPVAKALKHISLQTGTKHYISLRGQPDQHSNHYAVCCYDEQCPRMSNENNFYYFLEDLLMERLQGKIAWSIHRPGLIMGSSSRTLFNLMGSLCVYGAICRKLNLPFMFGGRRECWEEMCIDGSDARLVAEQHIWAATNDGIYSTSGQAFNAINGSSFTWKEIWKAVGQKLGAMVPENMFSQDFSFSKAMAGKSGIWKEIVMENGLVQTEIEDLANWDFLDILFRCSVKMLGSREKVDQLGFTMKYSTLESILQWIDVMREERLIPH